MPPIKQLDEAFLSQLINKDENIKDAILNNKIDSESLSSVLSKLNSTFNAYEEELFQKVYSNFDEFCNTYNTSQQLHARVLDLVKQASSSEEKVSETKDTTTRTIEEYQEAVSASQLNQYKIDTLEQLEHVLQVIEMIHSELKSSVYLKAADHILELTRILKEWKVDKRVIDMVTVRVENLKQTLILRLQEDVRTSIQFNPASMRILETFKPDPTSSTTVKLGEVFQCLDKFGLLAEEMMGVQRSIFKNIFNPYFDNGMSHLQVDHVQLDVGTGGVLQVINSNNVETDRLDPIQMLQQIDTMLAYFFKYMFNNNKDTQMNHLFGNLLLPDLEDRMIQKGISPAIPSSKYNLSDFDAVAEAVISFEKKCVEMYGFQVDDDDSALGLYVKNIDKHYAKKRNEKVLQEGRKVMIRRLYDAEMTQLEHEGHTYHFHITQTPQILSVLISDTLDEASELLKSHPISSSTLIEGIQDLLDMYRAVMPSYHRPYYLSGPANSLIFRNDCLWLSNHIKADIADKPVAQNFDGLVKNLNIASEKLGELGKAWYELTMMHRVQMIQTSLDKIDGFLGMADSSKFQHDCDHAISRVIELVGSFSSETRPVVDETLFLDMLGRIVDSVLVRLIHDIEELVDIGAEESHVIARTLNSLAQLVGAFDLPGRDATESFVSELVPSWEKFWLLKDILEMNMRDIMESFRKGNLHMFEKSELVGLLCSLFADTDLRSSNIQEIKTGITSPISANHHLRSPSNLPSQSYPSSHVTAAVNDYLDRSVTPTHTTSINSALNYTFDDEKDAAAWGDDDDLFADETLPSTTADTTVRTPEETKTSTSLKPSSSVNLSLAMEDTDMDDTAGGWGDDDDDLFANEEPTIPITADVTSTPEKSTTASTNQQALEEKSKHASLSTQPQSFDLSPDVDMDMEDTAGGWGEADEDLFDNQDIAVPETNVLIEEKHAGSDVEGGAKSEIPRATDKHIIPSSSTTTVPKQEKISPLNIQGLDDEIDNELNEEGEGWGWDDDDDDLFKEESDLK